MVTGALVIPRVAHDARSSLTSRSPFTRLRSHSIIGIGSNLNLHIAPNSISSFTRPGLNAATLATPRAWISVLVLFTIN